MQQPPPTPDRPARRPWSDAPGEDPSVSEQFADDSPAVDPSVYGPEAFDPAGYGPVGSEPAPYGTGPDAAYGQPEALAELADPAAVGASADYGTEPSAEAYGPSAYDQPVYDPSAYDPSAYDPSAYLAPGYAADPVPSSPSPPRDPGAKRRLVRRLVSVAAVLVLVIGGVVAVAMINQSRDPAAAVESYLELLERGEAEEANELVDPGLDKAERALLDDEVLGGAVERIRVERVETLAREGGSAEVVATIALGDESFSHTFEVEQGPNELLFLRTWEVADPLIVPAQIVLGETGALPAELDTVVTVGASDDGGAVGHEVGIGDALHVYPAIYEVAGDFGDYAAPATAALRAASPDAGTATAQLAPEPSPAFEEEVLSQVQGIVTGCVTVVTNMDSTCPAIVRRTNLEEMTAMQQAEYFDRIDFGGFESGEVKIGVRETPSRYDPNPSLETETFAVTGGIEWIDGGPRVVAPSFSPR